MNRAQRRQQARAPKPPAPPVVVVVAHNGNTRASFTFCLSRLMIAETCRQGFPPGLVWQRFGSDQLISARNDTAKFFLDEYRDSEWALFLDADMGFPDTTIVQLLDRADPVERPVVGALCFALKNHGTQDYDTQAVRLRACPTLYTWQERETESGFLPMTDYPRDALVQVAGTGMAVLLVHRTVLEAVREKYGTWFDRVPRPVGDGTFGEDLSFCVRVAGCDFPIYVDTSLKTAHDKEGVFLTEEHWDAQRASLT